MSTYNGERFVQAQIRSILDQLPANGLLMVRDDGSHDSTVARIAAFGDPRLQLQCGPNLGFARSFLTLLLNSPDDADVVMFSDQDDVWLPGKIERAQRRLSEMPSIPALYCSAQMLVDEDLRPLHRTPLWPKAPSFAGALSENIVTGCTAALNSVGVRELKRAGVPKNVHFHDWWIYLVISAFGRVLHDPEPTLLYRQHGGNLIGHGTGWWGRHAQVLRFLSRNDWVGILLWQVADFERIYGSDLDDCHRKRLYGNFRFGRGSARIRWRLIFGIQGWRQTRMNEVFFRLLLLAHKLRVWPWSTRRL